MPGKASLYWRDTAIPSFPPCISSLLESDRRGELLEPTEPLSAAFSRLGDVLLLLSLIGLGIVVLWVYLRV